MRIFSYNISWESMTGKKANWPLCSNNTDTTDKKHNSVCISNIAGVIKNNPADFILLQEASNFEDLIHHNIVLENMKYEVHKSGDEQMVSFWKSKYTMIKCIKGEFEIGRPWMAIIFSNGLCVVNIHMGHYTAKDVLEHLTEIIKKLTNKEKTEKIVNTEKIEKRTKIEKRKQTKKTKKHILNDAINDIDYKINRIVIGGDFNYDIKKLSKNLELSLDNKTFYHHSKKILTCCIKRKTHFDHVLDSKTLPSDIIIPYVQYMASDHKPILATLVN